MVVFSGLALAALIALIRPGGPVVAGWPAQRTVIVSAGAAAPALRTSALAPPAVRPTWRARVPLVRNMQNPPQLDVSRRERTPPLRKTKCGAQTCGVSRTAGSPSMLRAL